MNRISPLEELLNAKIVWIKEVGAPQWRAVYDGDLCELAMNDFPEEPLYTLRWRGKTVDFNDSPTRWILPRQ